MPKGPQGQKRPADVIGAAIMVAKIATGEIEEHVREQNPKRRARAQKGGAKGGPARAAALSPEERRSIAQKAAMKRWAKNSD